MVVSHLTLFTLQYHVRPLIWSILGANIIVFIKSRFECLFFTLRINVFKIKCS